VKRRNRRWTWLGLGCVAAAAITGVSLAEQARSLKNDPHDIETLFVRGNIYLIAGAGSNITASIGPDGVLLVDSGLPQMTDKVLAAVRKIQLEQVTFGQPVKQNEGGGGSGTVLTSYKPPKPIRYLLNTSALPEHTGGNPAIAAAGKTFTGGNVAGDLGDVSEGAAVLSHENVLQRLSDAKMATRGLPTETYFGAQMKLSHFFNGEGVQMLHIPNAATDGDSIVHFRTSDIIVAGDIFTFTSYPIIDIAKGGSVQGVLVGLNRMVDMVIPEFRSEGGTLVIPGHGRVADTADLAYYRDMTTIIRDRVQDMIKKGMTLEQVKAAKPTEDWDGRFGQLPSWTPDMFVEAVYKSLSAKK
jgi:cyclase